MEEWVQTTVLPKVLPKAFLFVGGIHGSEVELLHFFAERIALAHVNDCAIYLDMHGDWRSAELFLSGSGGPLGPLGPLICRI